MTAWQPASEPGDVIDPGWLGTSLALIALARAHGHPEPAEVAATALAVHRGTVITRGLPREIDAWIAEQTAGRRAADESLKVIRATFRDVEARDAGPVPERAPDVCEPGRNREHCACFLPIADGVRPRPCCYCAAPAETSPAWLGPGERRPVPDLPVDPVDVESWRRHELDRDAIWLARHIARLVEQAAHGVPVVTAGDVADLAHATVRRLRTRP